MKTNDQKIKAVDLPGESLEETLKRDGYPVADCKFAAEHTRFWKW